MEEIICPKCGERIQLTEALTSQIENKLRSVLVEQSRQREDALRGEYAGQLAQAQQAGEERARQANLLELESLRQQITEQERQLGSAREQELELRKRQRELERREGDLALDVARQLDQERQQIEFQAVARFVDENRLKDLERDKQFNDMRRQIEELKRKAEQGSQQTQGEAVELELEARLRASFPYDEIEPVGKGIKGADLVQRVHNPQGRFCGTLVWESKNTKTWNDEWVAKLKDDQRDIKAELAVIATGVLPKGVSHFGLWEGVWVTDFATVIGVASALRANLIQVAMARMAAAGKNEKMDMLYGYLAGAEFAQRVDAMVESFVLMRADLESEKRAVEKLWAKREKQIERITRSVAGMYGDMQGIIGATLPKIERLELPEPTVTPWAEA